MDGPHVYDILAESSGCASCWGSRGEEGGADAVWAEGGAQAGPDGGALPQVEALQVHRGLVHVEAGGVQRHAHHGLGRRRGRGT